MLAGYLLSVIQFSFRDYVEVDDVDQLTKKTWMIDK